MWAKFDFCDQRNRKSATPFPKVASVIFTLISAFVNLTVKVGVIYWILELLAVWFWEASSHYHQSKPTSFQVQPIITSNLLRTKTRMILSMLSNMPTKYCQWSCSVIYSHDSKHISLSHFGQISSPLITLKCWLTGWWRWLGGDNIFEECVLNLSGLLFYMQCCQSMQTQCK